MDVRDIIDVGIPVVVIFLMMLVGVRVTLDDFRPVLERPRLVGAALVAQLLVLPLLAGGMGWLAGVTPLALVALILIAACPAGVLSNVYTMVAGGERGPLGDPHRGGNAPQGPGLRHRTVREEPPR